MSNGGTRDANRSKGRGAFSLIECLTVIAIVGLILAIAIPAVQRARETARRINCASNLRQLSLAISAFESSKGVLPYNDHSPEPSWFHKLHPFLELQPITQVDYQEFVYKTLVCPSDPLATGTYGFGKNSFWMNEGLRINGHEGVWTTSESKVRMRDITDGLSNTALCAERLAHPTQVGQIDWSDAPEWWNRLLRTTSIQSTTLEEYADECRHRAGAPAHGTYFYEAYNHIMEPNNPGCIDGTVYGNFLAVPASSEHAAGVNLGLADGSVRFVSDAIDRRLWWGIGTRHRGEDLSEW